MIGDFGFPNITVLVPTNEAFEMLEPGAVPYLQSSNVHTYDINTQYWYILYHRVYMIWSLSSLITW